MPDYEQYALRVVKPGMYPILQTIYKGRSKIKAYVWLNIGDTWRFGITAFDEIKRYPGGIFFVSKDGGLVLTDKELDYHVL